MTPPKTPDALLSCADFPTLCAAATWLGRNPWAGPVVVGALIVGLMVFGFYRSARRQRAQDARLQRFVRSCGGSTRHDGGLVGDIPCGDGGVLHLRVVWSGTRQILPSTVGTVQAIDDGFTLDLRQHQAAATSGPVLSTGDARFDEVFRVSSSDSGRARAMLSAPVRAQLLGVVQADLALRTPLSIRRHGGTVFFTLAGHPDGAGFDRRLGALVQVVQGIRAG
ncbi:MAG: hypothetical protein JNK55_23700 [Rubrivivax sp.]|nr:hypothetical protein [Rubrivivax sp.]